MNAKSYSGSRIVGWPREISAAGAAVSVMTNQPEEVMTSATLDAMDACVPAEWPKEDVQSLTDETVADPTESVAQNTFRPTEIPFQEGRPWAQPAPDPFRAAFEELIREAEGFERPIADIESMADEILADTKGQLAPLEKQQIVACFGAWKLVSDGKIPISMMGILLDPILSWEP
jgi:hypothetical protein